MSTFKMSMTGVETNVAMELLIVETGKTMVEIIEEEYIKNERIGFELEAYFGVDVRIDSADHAWHN